MGDMKNVFVTGGSSGIGKAIVEWFTQDGDYIVHFTYNTHRESADAIVKKYNNVFAYQCDISQQESVESVIKELSAHGIEIDILINNAGIMKDSSFTKMKFSLWEQVLDTNLKSLYWFTHCFVESMQKKSWGRIINLSSVAGETGFFGKSNYSASKAGVIGFTKALALETARKGITVNAVAPGMIDTAMVQGIPEKYMAGILETIPMQRLGRPEEVAGLVFYLAGDAAAYITGQVIGINGGMYT